MKKTLEAELMSLAHRILQLKNRADIHELKTVTGVLYEKLTVLSFTEKHFAGAQPTIGKKQVEEALEDHQETKIAVENAVSTEEKTEDKSNQPSQTEIKAQQDTRPDDTKHNTEAISEQNTEKTEEFVEEKPSAPEQIDEVTEETSSGPEPIEETIEEIPSDSEPLGDGTEQKSSESEPEEDDIRNIGVHYDDLPQFEPVPRHQPATPTSSEPKISEQKPSQASAEPDSLETPEAPEVPKTPEVPRQKNTVDLFSHTPKKGASTRNNANPHKASLNDRLNKGINIGLNDRLTYIKHLFEGNAADYNRVLSQLNTIDSFDEAQRFIEQVVKPDYNQWEGKEVYENKFLRVIENKFN